MKRIEQWRSLLRMTMLVVLVTFTGAIVYGESPKRPEPNVGAEAAVMLDVETGRVLYSKLPFKWMHPASTTKVVTALTAIEKRATRMDEWAVISPYAVSMEPSSLGLKVGDLVTLQALIEGMMVVSGNDAAVAVAETVSGSVEAFAKDMNALAERAGATETVFLNPHGLTQVGHHTTAMDLAKIAQYGMKNQQFRDMIGFDWYRMHYANRPSELVRTTNRLLREQYPSVNGLKTGYTRAAGECLIASATRDGRTLVVVLLNDDYRWDDAKALLEYGFAELKG